jgi:enoyl-CoA hydratase
MSKVVELKQEQNRIYSITINRPESLNALNSEVLTELGVVLSELESKSAGEVAAIIVTGSGPKAFVAGADIKQINQLDAKAALDFAQAGQNLFKRFENLKAPVIAAVNGFALGGGLELALSCDFIVASENAKFGLPEVSLGLIPGFGGTVRLSRIVGLAKARQMIFTGDVLTSTEALEIGLALKVVKQEELLSTVIAMAQTISSRGPIAVAEAKRSINATFDLDINTAMKFEADAFADLFKTKDVKEGTGAFIEKRKPSFSGM